MTPDRRRGLSLRKRHFFLTEKYVEDIKQGQRITPDLVESIVRPNDNVKEELRRILLE